MDDLRTLKEIYWGTYDTSALAALCNSEKRLQQLVLLACEQKVLPHVLQVLTDHGMHIALPEQAQQQLDFYGRQRAMWLKTLKVLNSHPDIMSKVRVLKGLAFEAQYSDGRSRFALDMDLVVSDEQTFWSLMDLLLQEGLTLPGLSQIFTSEFDRQLEGIALLTSSEDEAERGVELHLRRFQLDETSYLPWHLLDSRLECIGELDNYRFKHLSPEAELLLFLCEMVTRPEVNLRDAYDAQMLFSRPLPEQHIPYLLKGIAAYQLDNVLHRLDSCFGQLNIPRPASLMQLLDAVQQQQPTPTKGMSAAAGLSWWQRTKQGWVLKLRTVMDNMATQDKWLGLLRRTDSSVFSRLMFKMGMPMFCLRLNLPAQAHQNNRKNGFWLRNGGEASYLVATNAILTDEELDELENDE